MGISEMTHASYLLMALAVLFGILSVILYFTLDIRRCWRIVKGRRKISCVKEMGAGYQESGGGVCQKTEKLVCGRTEMLLPQEETALPGTMTLIQDIVMINSGNCVNP